MCSVCIDVKGDMLILTVLTDVMLLVEGRIVPSLGRVWWSVRLWMQLIGT